MNKLKHRLTAKLLLFLIGIIVLGVSGCTVKYVSDYDVVIDKGTTALHKKLDGFLVKIQSETKDEKTEYVHFHEFYNDVLVDLNSLKVRAGAIYKNQITEKQLSLVEQNIGLLILLHKGTAETAELTDAQIKMIKDDGFNTVATSSENKHKLNKALVPIVRNSLNSHFGAIMKFELAKQRGEEPKSVK